MVDFLKRRNAQRRGVTRDGLGPLESCVMEVLWKQGECSVNDVLDKIDRPLAYTTVMTTLDRLYKKSLLERRRSDRAYLYSARLQKSEWERQIADALVTDYLAGPGARQELLLSSFVDALGQHNHALLDELEKKVQRKRKELSGRGRG